MQELVPNNILPNDFILSIKHSDYSSVSSLTIFTSLFYAVLPICAVLVCVTQLAIIFIISDTKLVSIHIHAVAL